MLAKNRITYGKLLPGLRGRRANDGDGEVTGYGILLFRRRNKGRARNDGFSGLLVPYGCGLCLVDGGAERTIRAGDCVLVMVEFESERERRQEQRDEERQFPVLAHVVNYKPER